MTELIKPKKISLYKALDIGYLRNEQKQQKRLKKFGYRLDKELTNKEHLVAYNPINNKLLYISNGSETNPLNTVQFVKDWTHNLIHIPTGTYGSSDRLLSEKRTLTKAKDKYKTAQVVLVGHSQSGQIINRLTGKNDKGYTLDPAYIGTFNNKNVQNYRVKGDLVSSLASDVKTLSNPSHLGKGIIPAIEAHDIENIKNQPIFV